MISQSYLYTTICDCSYVILKNIFDKVTSWPQPISKFWSYLPVCNAASDWLHTFLCPRCFCLALLYTVI